MIRAAPLMVLLLATGCSSDAAPAVAEGEVNFADLGLQLTRGWRALKVWLSIQTLGLDAFREAVERSLDLALLAESYVRASAALRGKGDAARREGSAFMLDFAAVKGDRWKT